MVANEAASKGNRDLAITLLMANSIGKEDAIALIDQALAFKKNGGTDDNFILNQKFVQKYYHSCMEQAELIPEDAGPRPKGIIVDPLGDDALRETGDDPPHGSCVGMLTQTPRGEYLLERDDKTICTFLPVYADIVLRQCKLGEQCVIYGSLAPCQNSDQCVAVSRIKSAQARE
jgi:hypothetical protein